MTSIRPTIDKAGRFPVKQVAVPFEHNLKVDWSAPPAGVLHTTEGGWTGSLSVFKIHYAPHFMLGMDEITKRVEIVQYVPVGLYGLALMSHPNGDGNKIARVQIEMIGYAQEKLWQPDLETLDALASLMNVCHEEWGIPLSHPWADGDFGRASDNPHRNSGKYGTVAGWFGHGDIPSPENHWDPGALAWSKIFARAEQLQPGSATAAQTTAPQSQIHAPLVENHGIAWAQEALNRSGWKPALKVDGKRGPETALAMRAFQKSKSLPPTGLLDTTTIKALAAL